MARIQQLSKNLVNQIAAGEVIERPASVVKELVENSIDAGATKISIEISNECRNIRVADNGSGIHPDDIGLAFLNHATSKIKDDNDLFEIATLGFRGEALASIISIAQVTCTTRTKDYDYGIKVECKNSEIETTQVGCAVGTIMNIQNLFYNVPARLKFLKNPKTEFSYIQELIQSLALVNANIAFELKKDDKIVLKTNGLGNLQNIIKDIYTKDLATHLKEVYRTDEISGLKISGYVSTPDYVRSSKKYNIYVNSRIVKCLIFQKAIDTAYKNLLSKGKYPFVILNLEIPLNDIDVNVHPTKKEVRYKNTNQIFSFIYMSIDRALSNFSDKSQTNVTTNTNITSFQSFVEKNSDKLSSNDTYINDMNVINPIRDVFMKPVQENNISKPKTNKLNLKTETETANFRQQSFVTPNEDLETEKSDKIIGQYKKTYILIETEEGLEIVDQHIADERYIYEKLKTQKEIASQMLFLSDVIEVSPTEAQLIKENKEKFEHFGFEIEVLNDKEVTFKKVPQLLSKVNTKEILSDILENLDGNIANLEERILITTSCKAAVKANQELSLFQMEELIKKWRKCEKPYTCPHGRPISKFIEHKKLAGFFERNK
ncbi:DNA mismatch repair endonuclease MutL [bacterium]|nr:DNA mismatch repair endonuclease MutL [bacterium]